MKQTMHPSSSISRNGRVVGFCAWVLLAAFLVGTAESFAPMTPYGGATKTTVASFTSSPLSGGTPMLNNNDAFLANSALTPGSTASLSTSLSASFLPIDDETSQKLIILTFEKLIDAGVPAVLFVLTTWWFLSQFKGEDGYERGGARGMMGGGRMGGNRAGGRMRGGGRGQRGGSRGQRGMSVGGFDSDGGRPLGPVEELYDDIYDDLSGPEDNAPTFLKLLGGGGPNKGRRGGGMGGGNDIDRPTAKLNIGIPKRQYLKVTKLNSKYDSYRYSMIKATKGKAAAAAELRTKGFEEALWKSLGINGSNGGSHNGASSLLDGLSSHEGTSLLRLERDFLSEGAELIREVAELTREITNAAILDEMDDMGVEAGVLDAERNMTDVIDAEVVGKKDVITQAQRNFFLSIERNTL